MNPLVRVAAAVTVVASLVYAANDRREPLRAVSWSATAGVAAQATLARSHGGSIARASTCAEARERVAEILVRDDATFTQEETIDITTLGNDTTSLDDEDGACVDRVLAAMRMTTRCTRGYAALASGIASSPRAPDDGIERLAAEATPACGELVLRALATGAHVTARLVAFVESSLASTEQRRRESAWLALGTLGRLARTRADGAPLAEHVEKVIRGALVAAKGDEQVLLLEAAGNAACASCVPEIDRATRSERWDVRRAAIAAWRFQGGAEAPAAMCVALLRDDSAGVRENAAWAMRWRAENDAERVECLVTAAATDAAPAVRNAATLSLVVLSERSTDARSALVHLTGEAYAPEVRELASDFTMTTDFALSAAAARAVLPRE